MHGPSAISAVGWQWSLELFPLGAQFVEVTANRSLGLVRLLEAPASVICHRPVDWSLKQWSHYACPCSASAHELCGIHSTQLSWSPQRHVHDTVLCSKSEHRFLHAVAMPLPGTPIGGERPARVAANDTAGENTPAGLPAEEDTREQSLDIFADPVVALPEQLHLREDVWDVMLCKLFNTSLGSMSRRRDRR